jgi:serine/threonine protein kinase
MIHRDVKPGNIVLLNSPDAVGATVKIVDFGIAKLTDSQYGAQKLTTAGEVFGSPLYMSPEQSMAQALDPRTDIYSSRSNTFRGVGG